MPSLRQIRRLPNTTDFTAPQIARVERAAAHCMSVFGLRGYTRIETPLIEETELFLRKSGGELSSRLYDFNEPGGFRTSLRPEFTSPVIRYAIETGSADSGISRYQYFGPVFRYAAPEHPDGRKTRQFNQVGAELIGAPAPKADGEIIAMALEGLAKLGVPPVSIALGHVGLLRQLLQKFQLSERTVQFLLNSMEMIANDASGEGMERLLERAGELGYLGSDGKSVADTPQERRNIEAVLSRSLGPLGINAGSRTREEVIARLARKQTYADDPARFRTALAMLGELAAISGDAGASIAAGRKLATQNGLDEGCFSLLEQVLTAAEEQGVDSSQIKISYGMARGVAYYTGMVFDILPGPDAADSLGGGGRYDGLTRALGLDADVPALGFAYNFDAVLAAVASSPEASPSTGPVLVIPVDDASWKAAAAKAAELREQGTAAVTGTGDTSNGYSEVITVDTSGNRVQEDGR